MVHPGSWWHSSPSPCGPTRDFSTRFQFLSSSLSCQSHIPVFCSQWEYIGECSLQHIGQYNDHAQTATWSINALCWDRKVYTHQSSGPVSSWTSTGQKENGGMLLDRTGPFSGCSFSLFGHYRITTYWWTVVWRKYGRKYYILQNEITELERWLSI